MTQSRSLLIAAAACALLVSGLSACNTIEGAGQDIEAGGDAIEDSARDTKHNM